MTRIKALLVLLLVPCALPSQNPPQAPPIRVSTHLVQIGIIVRDNNGPVTGLTKDDFALLDRGKPQKIDVFAVESEDSASLASDLPSQPAAPLPPNTFSDRQRYPADQQPRSLTIILLDNLNTLSTTAQQPYEDAPYWPEQLALANAKQHLLEFLKNMEPRDRVAIYGLSDSLHALCDFTCDRDQLLESASKYDAKSKTRREDVQPGEVHLPNAPPEVNQAICADALRLAGLKNRGRAQTTMAALRSISTHLENIPGRKNLLWLTANLPFSGAAIASVLSHANIVAYPVDARGLLTRATPTSEEEVNDFEAYFTGAKAAPLAQSDEPIGLEAMQEMADDTGGRAFINTNDLTGAIRGVVEDSVVTYTLGFYVDSGTLDGKFHKLRVQVRRSGLHLQYPKGYFALKDAAAAQDERRAAFLTALRSPLDSAAIPLEVRVDRLDQPTPHALALTGSVGIHDIFFAQTDKLHVGALDVTVLQQNQTGKVLHESTNRIHLRFTEGKYSALIKSGINFRESVRPQPGATTLRVLVQDPATAAIGSLIIPLSQIK
jgi:VWFA-related protein